MKEAGPCHRLGRHDTWVAAGGKLDDQEALMEEPPKVESLGQWHLALVNPKLGTFRKLEMKGPF